MGLDTAELKLEADIVLAGYAASVALLQRTLDEGPGTDVFEKVPGAYDEYLSILRYVRVNKEASFLWIPPTKGHDLQR